MSNLLASFSNRQSWSTRSISTVSSYAISLNQDVDLKRDQTETSNTSINEPQSNMIFNSCNEISVGGSTNVYNTYFKKVKFKSN